MSIDKKRVGNLIKSIRLQQGLTMQEFGKKLDTSKGAVNNWEKGINLPSKDRLKSISEMGNLTVNELLYGEPLEEENLYQYLVSSVHYYFKENENTLKEQYSMDDQKINSLLQKSLNYVSENYKKVTFEEEDKRMKASTNDIDDSFKHPYFQFRQISTNTLLKNIKSIVQTEAISDNPNINLYGVSAISIHEAENKVLAYVEYLNKNNIDYEEEVSEKILKEISKLSDYLKKAAENHNLS